MICAWWLIIWSSSAAPWRVAGFSMCDTVSLPCSTRSNGVMPAAMSAWVTCTLRVRLNEVIEMPIAEPMLRARDCIEVASPRSEAGKVVYAITVIGLNTSPTEKPWMIMVKIIASAVTSGVQVLMV